MTRTEADELELARTVIRHQKAVLADQREEILALKYELARQRQHNARQPMIGFMTSNLEHK